MIIVWVGHYLRTFLGGKILLLLVPFILVDKSSTMDDFWSFIQIKCLSLCLCFDLCGGGFFFFCVFSYRCVSRLVKTWCPVKASVVGCFISSVWVCHSNLTRSCFVRSAAQVRSCHFVQDTAIGQLFCF